MSVMSDSAAVQPDSIAPDFSTAASLLLISGGINRGGGWRAMVFEIFFLFFFFLSFFRLLVFPLLTRWLKYENCIMGTYDTVEEDFYLHIFRETRRNYKWRKFQREKFFTNSSP